MEHLNSFERALCHWLEEDRGLLSVDDIMVLEDCFELVQLIRKTEDEMLRKIHLTDLSLKLAVFFLKDNDLAQKLKSFE